MKNLLGPLWILLVAVFPIAIWLAFTPRAINALLDRQWLEIVAICAALAALSLLAFNIILSARLSIFERLFLGLDRAYRMHRIIGCSVLLLAMMHAMAITAQYSNISLANGYDFLMPNADIPLMIGKLTLATLFLLVSASVYINLRYKWFITTQRILGGLLFLAGYHALFVSGSELRSNPVLFAYFLCFGGLAACLYIYRSLIHRSTRKNFLYTVVAVRHINDITMILLQPAKNAMAFYAGQFGFFRFNSVAVDTESHPFSISSGSNNERIRISVKKSGDYTAQLAGIKIGDSAQIEGPYGSFSFTKIRSNRQVWIAGGIGITPFLSMAHSLPSGYNVTLYYCVKNAAEAVFMPELQKIASNKKSFHVVPVYSDKKRLIANDIYDRDTQDYLICGPIAMMHDIESGLRSLGVSNNTIYYEEFTLK